MPTDPAEEKPARDPWDDVVALDRAIDTMQRLRDQLQKRLTLDRLARLTS